MKPALLLLAALAACSGESTPLALSPIEPVEIPDALPAPAFPMEAHVPAGWDTWDQARVPAKMMEETALRYGQEGKWANAALVQYQWMQTGERPLGRYTLARYLSRAGDLDGAIYWLQEAAVHEGVDATWANQDPELVPLHQDPRWRPLLEHLQATERYWAAHGPGVIKVVVPEGVDATTPQPVLVLLHGLASDPTNVAAAMMPALWNAPKAAVSVSGSIARGPTTFSWSEDPTRDHKRVQAALAEAAGELTIDPKRVALVGFSQGGLVALDLLAMHPESYVGAIAFSPGGNTLGHFDRAHGSLAGRHVVIAHGELEDVSVIKLAERAASTLRREDAEVVYRVSPGQANHALPVEFQARFPGWVEYALGGPAPAE